MTERHEGGCVCGAVRFVAVGDPERVSMCHCTWCQRRTGSAFGTEAVYLKDRVTVTGDTVETYRHISDESGRWLDQYFCKRCGTNLGMTLEAVPEIRSLAAGTFDNPGWLKPGGTIAFRHIYHRNNRGWADVPDGMARYEKHFRKD